MKAISHIKQSLMTQISLLLLLDHFIRSSDSNSLFDQWYLSISSKYTANETAWLTFLGTVIVMGSHFLSRSLNNLQKREERWDIRQQLCPSTHSCLSVRLKIRMIACTLRSLSAPCHGFWDLKAWNGVKGQTLKPGNFFFFKWLRKWILHFKLQTVCCWFDTVDFS